MPTKKNLHLYEEILLLTLRDREGTIASGTWYLQAVAGALLAELLLEGHLAIEGKTVAARGGRTGDPLLDESLDLIVTSRRRRTPAAWISKLSGSRDLKRRATAGLCKRGILAADRKQVLLFFERRIFPEIDHEPERAVVERLRRAVEGESTVDPRTTVLLALANHSGILRAAFGKRDLKRRKRRIEQVIEGNAMGKATQEVVQAASTAILVTTIIAST